jgi:hypothetical protein
MRFQGCRRREARVLEYSRTPSREQKSRGPATEIFFTMPRGTRDVIVGEMSSVVKHRGYNRSNASRDSGIVRLLGRAWAGTRRSNRQTIQL